MNPVEIVETQINIPTYNWRQADMEPPLMREFTPRGQPIYPYTAQETVAEAKASCSYKAVVLENEYLKLTFLPELNGRLYSFKEKAGGRELLFSNPVIKPALLGLRGAWAATGVEYNFPNSHSTTTMEAVAWKVRRYEDGAASFTCGNVEWVSRMEWSVEVKLSPGHSRIEMESRLYNCTEFPQRYYYWVNAAVPAFPGTQFIFPPSTKRLYTHPPMDISRLAYLDYPIHKGRDISRFKNIIQQLPIFAERMEEDFFGVYHHDHDYGLVQVADHALVKGRKIWTWGTARDGRVSVDSLTEDGADYCEVQSGPFTLQSDYRMLPPGREYRQKEVWYPVAGTGGFNAASGDIAAQVTVTDNEVAVAVNAVRKMEPLKVRLRAGGEVREKDVVVSPLMPAVVSWPGPTSEYEPKIDFLDESNRVILRYRHRPSGDAGHSNDDLYPAGSHAGFSPDAGDDACLQGRYLEEQGYPAAALAAYETQPSSLAARVAHAGLTAAGGQFKAALSELEDISAATSENSRVLYLAGICLKHLGDYHGAERKFAFLAEDMFCRREALLQLVETSAMAGDYEQALSRVEHLPELCSDHTYAAALRIMLLRKTGSRQKAVDILKGLQSGLMLEPLLAGEMHLLGLMWQEGADAFLNLSPQQTIETVCRYMGLKDFEDGLEILRSYMDSGQPVQPLLFYYRGYLEHRLGMEQESKASFNNGRESRGKWDFAFRLETEAVLCQALEFFPKDSRALCQLGNLLASKGRWEEAVVCYSGVNGDDLPQAMRCLGLFHWQIKGQPEEAVRFYGKALAAGSGGAKTVWEYDCLLEELGQTEARLALFKEYERLTSDDKRLMLRLANAQVAAGHIEEALDILMNNGFLLCEGKIMPRLLYERACRTAGMELLEQGRLDGALAYFRMPLEYPENLGVGKPSRNMEAEWWWRSGKTLEKMGCREEAAECYVNGALKGCGIDIDFFPLRELICEHGPANVDVNYWISEFFRALCLRETGEATAGGEILDKIKAVAAGEGICGDMPEDRLFRVLAGYAGLDFREEDFHNAVSKVFNGDTVQ